MATTPTVLGNGPLEYTDPNSGKQISIPLSALFFDPKNNNQLSIDPSKWPDPNTTPITLPGFIPSILKNLVQQQLILPAPTPVPKQAMIITATDPGTAGNGIKVTTAITASNPDPTQTVFSVQVEETDVYTGLTISTISQVLGTDKKASANPGLLHVVLGTLAGSGVPGKVSKQAFTLSPPPPPPAPDPSAQSVVNDNAKKQWVILEAKKPGPDGALTVVSIDNVDKVNGTFDLTAYWTKTVTGIKLATVQTNLGSLGYVIGASAPQGGIFSVPAAGVVQLTGGAPGTPASAVLFSA
jgi:hypothetical protein